MCIVSYICSSEYRNRFFLKNDVEIFNSENICIFHFMETVLVSLFHFLPLLAFFFFLFFFKKRRNVPEGFEMSAKVVLP